MWCIPRLMHAKPPLRPQVFKTEKPFAFAKGDKVVVRGHKSGVDEKDKMLCRDEWTVDVISSTEFSLSGKQGSEEEYPLKLGQSGEGGTVEMTKLQANAWGRG